MKNYYFYALILLALNAANVQALTVNPPPGTYNSDQEISINSENDVYIYFDESENKTPLRLEKEDEIILSSLFGEERSYTLVINETKYAYTIDKKLPEPPEIEITGENEIIFKTLDNSTVFFKTNNDKKWSKWINSPVKAKNNEIVFSYAQDSAGNKSIINESIPFISLDHDNGSINTGLEILNPPPGSYFNRQILSINTNGYEYIKFSYDENLPEDKWTYYQKPVLIDKTGDISIFIEGKKLFTGETISKKLNFIVDEMKKISVNPSKNNNIWTFNANADRRIEYSLDIKNPTYGFMPFTSPVKYETQPGRNNVFALNFKYFNDQSGYVYRYYLEENLKTPDSPIIKVSSIKNEAGRILLQIFSHENYIYYSLDGKEPDIQSLKYEDKQTLTLPERVFEGTLIIKSAVILPDGRKSRTSEYMYSYNTTIPPKPVLSGIVDTLERSKRLIIDHNDSYENVYTISYSKDEPPGPDLNSPGLIRHLDIAAPFGSVLSFNIKISSKNKTGFVSEPLIINNVVIDSYPPDIPDIDITDKEIFLKSSFRIFYTLKSEKSIFSGETWKEYKNPIQLSLLPDFSDLLEIQYYAVDDSGNKSRQQSKQIKASNIYPDLFNIDNIIGNGIFNKNLVIEPDENTAETKYFYTVSDNLREPSDPASGNNPLTRLELKAAENEEKQFILKVLPVNNKTGNTGGIKKYIIVINKKIPEVPVMESVSDRPYYMSEYYLNISKINSHDKIFYSFTTDGTEPADPFESQLITDNMIKIKIPEDTKKNCRITLGVENYAGTRAVFPDAAGIVLDSRKYTPVKLSGITDNTISSKDLVIQLIENDDFITRYELSKNIFSTSPVNQQSPVLDRSLKITAEINETSSYILRVRKYLDLYDQKGSVEKIFNIVIDKTPPLMPELSEYEPDKIYREYVINFKDTYDKIYYSVSSDKYQKSELLYKSFISSEILRPDNGAGKYTIKAYSIDSAGNKSNIAQREVYLADKIVYVSKNGSNSNSGLDMNNPVESADYALRKALEIKADAVLFAEGNYPISSSFSSDRNFLIKGKNGKTILTADRDNSEPVVINAFNSKLFIKDVSIESGSYNYLTVSGTNADIYFDNTGVEISGDRFIDINSCTLSFSGSKISLKGKSDTTMFNIINSRFYTSNTEINLNAEGKSILINLNKSNMVSDRSFIDVISASDSIITKAQESNLFIKNNVIKGASTAGSIKGFDLVNCEAELTDSFIFLQSMKTYAVYMKNSTIDIIESRIDNRESPESFGIFSQADGLISIKGSRLNNSGSRSSNALLIENAETLIENTALTGWDD